ncbi:MAG TPA: low specificity L-threonine aldolase [Oceanospirillales bacterium]|nr:low specificity L-threonine aldolase [Oceanospirillales bacterium]
MNFRSDNEAPVNERILAAMVAANKGFEQSYGYDSYTEKLIEKMQQLFGCWCDVIPLTTGTAANSLATALTTPPYASMYCSDNSHLHNDECGAPEFFSAGAKLIGVAGTEGKIDLELLDKTLSLTGVHGEHECLPAAISLTQSTEAGTLYSLDEIKQAHKIKQKYQLYLHMDGSRIANAVAAMNCSIADMTWKNGVDLLSFGATKNGAMVAEALIIFNPKIGTEIKRRRKRAGHLISKMRFVSAQLLAYLEDNLWLQLATHANQQATTIFQALQDRHEFIYPVQANEVFLRLSVEDIDRLKAKGFEFHIWPGSRDIIRLVCSHMTAEKDVQSLIRELLK